MKSPHATGLVEALEIIEDSAEVFCDVRKGMFVRKVEWITEEQTRSGPIDLIVVADVAIEGEEAARRRAFVWELKAPQVHVFETEARNRCKPSADLISAENQLYHYHSAKQGDEEFRSEYAIMDSHDVRLGGVLIGRSDTRLKISGKANRSSRETELERVRDRAFRIRRKYIYDPLQMNLLTWTNILERLKPSDTMSILDGVFGEGIEVEGERSAQLGEYILTVRKVG